MLGFRAIRLTFCCLVSFGLGGCLVVIPTVPLNAPGYGHTYQIVDQHGRPIKDGFLILKSFYRANEEMFRSYPIKDGRAEVPLKIATRCSVLYWLYVPVWSFRFENPYGTYVYPVSRGHIYDAGWDLAPWDDNPEFMNGLSPPPKILRMRGASPDTERKDLKWLAYAAQIRSHPKEDQTARNALKAYILKRLHQLRPPKVVLLDKAIGRKDLEEVRRLLDAGACADFQRLHNLWRPIYRAVMSGNVEIVRLLLERGAQVNMLDAMDRSPLFFARDEQVRKLLLQYGADPQLGERATTRPTPSTRDE